MRHHREFLSLVIWVLILAASVTCEWVEISQNYHRQGPPRSKHNNDLDGGGGYRNQSLNFQWNKAAVTKVANVGNVRRVPYASVKTPFIKPNLDMGVGYTSLQIDGFPLDKVTLTTDVSIHNPYHDVSSHTAPSVHKYNGVNTDRNLSNIKEGTNDYKLFNESDVTTSAPILEKSEIQNSLKDKTIVQVKKLNRVYADMITKTPGNKAFVKSAPTQNSHVFRIENVLNSSLKETKLNVEDNTKDNESEGTHYPDNTSTRKLEGLWNVIQTISETITKNTQRTFGGKVRYLDKLKNSVQSSIATHIDLCWPDDETDPAAPRRQARAAQARGHSLEIPSSESALMTISFLTFAVFLIKLVLQVIHTYKNKAMMVSPAVVTAFGRAAHLLTRTN